MAQRASITLFDFVSPTLGFYRFYPLQTKEIRFYFISYKMSKNTTNLIEDSNRAELNAYLNFKKRAFEEGNLRNYFMENLFKSTQFFNQFFLLTR